MVFPPGRMPFKDSNSEDVVKDLSSDGAKEDMSVVDSSLFECKNDMENFDGLGSSCYIEHEEYSSGFENMSSKDIYSKHARYFVIKSLNHQNIQLSIEQGIWATQVMNEPILEEAFHNSDRVILIFSVNMSGFFQGYAQMMSSVGWRRDNVWTGVSGGNNPWGSTFKVKWLQLNNLPFQKTLHLKNPLNDYKPVKISRDCQELSPEIGEALCELIDGRVDVDGMRKRSTFFRDELLGRSNRESPLLLHDEGYAHTIPTLHAVWSRIPMFYPPMLYPNVAQPQTSNMHMQNGETMMGSLPKKLVTNSKGSKGSHLKHSSMHGTPTYLQGDRGSSCPMDDRHLSAKRGTFTHSPSEDDFLSMTYEEYLQAHGRFNDSSQHLAAGPSWTEQESLSRGQDDEKYLQHPASWYCI